MKKDSYPVKVGVIGIGNMGWHHARVLSLLKDAELVGVADLNEERGKLAVDQFQCDWYENYHDLIAKVDAICIAVPTLSHHKQPKKFRKCKFSLGIYCLRFHYGII